MKIDLEKILLAVFFLSTLYLGPGILFDHQISHDYPYAYSASDAFQHQIRAEAIKDAGHFKYEASYISKGIEKATGRYPPLLYHVAVLLSYAAGIEVYDAIYFIITFFTILSALVLYFVIKAFNKTVALLSLPLAMVAFSFPPSLGFLWGHWPSILAQAFLIVVFYTTLRMDLKHSYILIAIAVAATTLTHTSETIFAILFLGIYFLIKLALKKLTIKDIKIMIAAVITYLIITFYYLIIFWNTWAKAQPYSFKIQPIWEGNPGFYIAGFGILLVIMIIGMIVALTKIKQLHVAIIAAFSMIIAGFMNYVGFEVRSFQIRFFWPIYLSIFLGLGIYIIVKLVLKKWNFISITSAFLILTVLVSGFISYPIMVNAKPGPVPEVRLIPSVQHQTSPGMMNQYHWEAFNWLADNTPIDARTYFMFGSIYSQDAVLRNSKRFHYQVDPDSFAQELQSRTIKREYVSELPGDNGGSIVVRTGLFSFEDGRKDMKPEDKFGPQDLCSFDYIILDKQPQEHGLIQYNLLIANELVTNGLQPVFDNNVVVILRNDNVGGECIEEKTF